MNGRQGVVNKRRYSRRHGQTTLYFVALLVTILAIFIINVAVTSSIRYPASRDSLLYTTVSESRQPLHRNEGSSLRLDWTNLPPLSPLGKRIHLSQSKCHQFRNGTAPQQTFVTEMEESGLGSSLHIWSQSLCHAVDHDKILVTEQTWDWNDQSRCSADSSEPLACYFGSHVSAARNCPVGSVQYTNARSDYMELGPREKCDELQKEYTVSEVRAASMEWLFQNVSTIVMDEAERQMQTMFGNNKPTFQDLVTVHIRWGDKVIEDPLLPVEDYIKYTLKLLTPDELNGRRTVHIYLATEDPTALAEFRDKAPNHWKIYVSGPKIGNTTKTMIKTARFTKGAAGLESIAALLIALEANRYVLASGSNWSRLINELRKNVVDPRCSNCTRMINIHEEKYGKVNYGEW